MKYLKINNSQRTLLASICALFLITGCELVDNIRGTDEESESSETLHPVLLNAEWGFMNQSGSIIITPQFETARDFKNGFAAIRNNQSWGFVNESTRQIAIAPSFNSVGDFDANGLAPAQVLGQSYGFIDQGGNFVIPAQFDLALDFSEDRAAVRVDGQWGYVDGAGTVVIPTTFSDARPFSEGLAAVETIDGWVYINTAGETVINPSFQVTSAREFSEGMAAIQTTDGWGFIDTNGAPIINPEFDEVGKFSQGLSWLRHNNFIGYIDTEGTFVIEAQFAEAREFSENLAAVRLSSNWYYVNRESGKLQFAQGFTGAENFINGIARVRQGSDDDPRFGYIDKQGQFVWFPTQ